MGQPSALLSNIKIHMKIVLALDLRRGWRQHRGETGASERGTARRFSYTAENKL